MPKVPVVQPIIIVSDFIIEETKERNVKMLVNFVDPEDISLIMSLTISGKNYCDSYCHTFTKNYQYTIKS